MKEFFESCNTYEGRWNRKKFWLYPLGMLLLIVVPLFILLGIASTISNVISGAVGILLFIAYIYSFYVSIGGYIKRFHDLGKSGWYTLLIFIPFVNLFALIWLGFFKGTSGPNMYGPDPLGNTGVIPSQNSTNTPIGDTFKNQEL